MHFCKLLPRRDLPFQSFDFLEERHAVLDQPFTNGFRDDWPTSIQCARSNGQSVVTFWIEKPCNAVLALSDAEDPLEPFPWLERTRRSPVDQVRSIPVHKSAESQSVPPGTGEIAHPYARVSRGRSSGPSQEGLARCHVRFLADYVGYLRESTESNETVVKPSQKYMVMECSFWFALRYYYL